MPELDDWDFPVPDSVILLWLSLLETMVWGGLLLFAVSLLYRGGFFGMPYRPNLVGVMILFLLLFGALSAKRLQDNDLVL